MSLFAALVLLAEPTFPAALSRAPAAHPQLRWPAVAEFDDAYRSTAAARLPEPYRTDWAYAAGLLGMQVVPPRTPAQLAAEPESK